MNQKEKGKKMLQINSIFSGLQGTRDDLVHHNVGGGLGLQKTRDDLVHHNVVRGLGLQETRDDLVHHNVGGGLGLHNNNNNARLNTEDHLILVEITEDSHQKKSESKYDPDVT